MLLEFMLNNCKLRVSKYILSQLREALIKSIRLLLINHNNIQNKLILIMRNHSNTIVQVSIQTLFQKLQESIYHNN